MHESLYDCCTVFSSSSFLLLLLLSCLDYLRSTTACVSSTQLQRLLRDKNEKMN